MQMNKVKVCLLGLILLSNLTAFLWWWGFNNNLGRWRFGISGGERVLLAIETQSHLSPSGETDPVFLETWGAQGSSYEDHLENRIFPDVQCLRQSQKGAFYFLHLRKAGGSTGLNVFRDFYACKRHVQVIHNEAMYFDPAYFAGSEGMIFFTIIRDPMSRIRSLFGYEGMCTPGRPCDEPETDFASWVFDTIHDNKRRREENQNHIWIEIDNYYVRRLTAMVSANPVELKEKVDENDLELAKTILARFHLVLTTEQLGSKKKNMQMFLKNYLNMPGKEYTAFFAKKNAQGGNRKDRANALIEQARAVYDHLVELNKYDLELYKFARGLPDRRRQEFAGWLKSTHGQAPHRRDGDACAALQRAAVEGARARFGPPRYDVGRNAAIQRCPDGFQWYRFLWQLDRRAYEAGQARHAARAPLARGVPALAALPGGQGYQVVVPLEGDPRAGPGGGRGGANGTAAGGGNPLAAAPPPLDPGWAPRARLYEGSPPGCRALPTDAKCTFRPAGEGRVRRGAVVAARLGWAAGGGGRGGGGGRALSRPDRENACLALKYVVREGPTAARQTTCWKEMQKKK